jgi:hypothetical protein
VTCIDLWVMPFPTSPSSLFAKLRHYAEKTRYRELNFILVELTFKSRSTVHHVKEPRVAKTKNGFAPRVCERCGLPFEWRKKWEKNWDAVKYCSTKCRENK